MEGETFVSILWFSPGTACVHGKNPNPIDLLTVGSFLLDYSKLGIVERKRHLKTGLLLFVLVVFSCATPVTAQTFQPFDVSGLAPLSPQNAQELTQLQVYGQGRPGEVAWSPDGSRLAVADTVGVWLYDAKDWTAAPKLIATFGWVYTHWDASWGPLVEFSPNGELLAFSGGSSIRFWDVQAQTELQSLEQQVYATSIAFSPDGTQFVAGGYLQLVFWNTATWEIEKVWTSPHTNDYVRFAAIAFSPDGRLLATNGSYRGNTRLWNPSGETIEDAAIANLGVSQFDNIVMDIEFSPDGELVVSAGLIFGVIRAFNTTTFEEIPLDTSGGSTIAFSPDGQLLATARTGVPHPGPYTGPTTVELFDTATYEPEYVWEGHESVLFLAFSPNGDYLAAVSAFDGRVRILDVNEKHEVGSIHTALNASNLATSPNSQQLALDAIAFGGSGLIEIETGEVIHQHQQISHELQIAGNVAHSVFNRDGDYLVAEFTGVDVLLVNETDQTIHRLEIPGRYVLTTFSADGEVLAGNGEDLTVWKTDTGEILSEIATERLSLNQRPILSPDGRYVALVEGPDAAGFLRIWDTSNGQVVSELHSFPVSAIAFHPTLDIVAIADNDRIRLWNIQTGERLNTFTPSGLINSFNDTLTFSNTGDQLIFGSHKGAIHIWNWETATLVDTLEGHETVVNEIVLSDDETIMLSSDFDGYLLLWDYANLKLLKSVWTGRVGIDRVILSPDKRMIFILGVDGVVTLWGVESDNQ